MPKTVTVALRKESVDRNKGGHRARHRLCVALRKESVDRNCPCDIMNDATAPVALRKESVDRNLMALMINKGKWRRSPQGERG